MNEFLRKIVIFTDLDGTLLDSKYYSFEKSSQALNLIKKLKIPLIFVSSKTKSEIEYYRKKMRNQDPFVSENGGGIFIPTNYFRTFKSCKKNKDYYVIRIGEKYSKLRKALTKAKEKGFKIKGFGDMSIKEIMEITNLKKREAEFCKDRYFDEPFLFYGKKEEENQLVKFFKSKGLKITKGKYYHLLGNNDKGKAVNILLKLYKKEYGKIFSIGFGDSLNDLPMLKKVDYPVLVKKESGEYENIKVKNLILANKIGPEGWNEEILNFFSKFKDV